jgi:hypothetical protein
MRQWMASHAELFAVWVYVRNALLKSMESWSKVVRR